MSSCKATESFCFVHTTQYIYEEDSQSALERSGRQVTFKFRALWSVRDGKGLMNRHFIFNVVMCAKQTQRTELQVFSVYSLLWVITLRPQNYL